MQVKIKTIKYLIVCIICINFSAFGQEPEPKITITAEQAQFLHDKEEEIKKWVEDLKTPGVKVDNDQMIFSNEAQKLINNPEYRKEVYKDTYTFVDVKESLSKSEIQKAFWKLINIYPEKKDFILKYIYLYDHLIPSDQLVVSAFYTYAFFDPKITKLTNGKPVVYRPDLFEEYLRRTKEIVGYMAYFREEEKKGKIIKLEK